MRHKFVNSDQSRSAAYLRYNLSITLFLSDTQVVLLCHNIHKCKRMQPAKPLCLKLGSRRFLVRCGVWRGACRIIVCDQAGRCDREALCPIPRWVAGACCLRRRWSCLRRCRGSGRRARAWRPRARSISGPGGFPGLVRSRCRRFPARRCVPRPLPVPCAVGGRARTGRRRAGSPICRSGVPGAS